MVGPPCLVLQRRRVSAVHLAGSSIPTRVHTALGWSMQQHRSNVLMHVLLTPAVTVFPLICKIARTCSVMYMTGILAVVTIMLQHCLKSSGHVMQNHVCDVIFCTKFSSWKLKQANWLLYCNTLDSLSFLTLKCYAIYCIKWRCLYIFSLTVLPCVNIFACFTTKLLFIARESVTGASCDDAFVIGSTCYKIHNADQVPWFTAVNRCLSNNAILAVFDDDFRRNVPTSLFSETNAWIGLVKSWWTWSG